MSVSSTHGQLAESLSCPICIKLYNEKDQRPISLGCGHTVCRVCLIELEQKKCPYDDSTITKSVHELPVNYALLRLVGLAMPEKDGTLLKLTEENASIYESCKRSMEDLSANMNCITDEVMGNECDSIVSQSNNILSRPMQRKLASLINCQLIEEEGRVRALRAARSLGERTVVELILQHQNPQQLSANLWAAVRARGCQFLGPEMQEEVLKLILLALEDGSALARKVLVLFVVQKLEATFTQASKTAIGHVVQLLYRASCFKVTKKDDASSLMQLKDEYRSYDGLRREHDSQIVQIAMEAGLRISPEQWSSLLYGDPAHKSHMQSIIDKLQTPQSFTQSVNELMLALQRTSDPGKLYKLQPHLEILSRLDICQDKQATSWENVDQVLKSLKVVVQGLLNFLKDHNHKKWDLIPIQNVRYKTSLCRDFSANKNCPRGAICTFAHSEEELERYRSKKKVCFKTQTVSLSAPNDLHIQKNEEKLTKRFTDNKTEAHTPKEAEKLIKVVNGNKSSIVTNVVKPMMMISATRTVCLSTDTTTSMATSASMTSVSTSNRTQPNPILTDLISAHSLSSFPVQSNVCGVYNPSEAYNTFMVAQPNDNSADMLFQSQSFTRPTGAAARYPVPSPVFQPYTDTQQHSATCAHGYSGLVCDHPPHFAQTPGITHYHPGNSSLHTINEPCNSSNVFIEQQREDMVTASSGLRMTLQQPIVTTNMTDQQFSNQANLLHNLHCRREEILSQIHNNIQMTPVFREAVSTYTPNSQLSSYRVNGDVKTTNLTSKESNSSAQVRNVANGLSQTEKAYTILKKELSRNPVQAPNPQELSWSTPSDSVSVLEFQNQILKAQLTSTIQDKCLSETLHSGNIWGRDATKDTSNISDMDIEVDGCQFESFCSTDYHQWSTFDLRKQNSSEQKIIEDTVQYHGTNLLEWFQKSSAAIQVDKNDVDDFIPFDPPIVSKFGPISRVARSRIKNSDPVIVTADKEISKMTPVTAVTPMQRPYPVSAPAPSRYKVPGQKINSKPDPSPVQIAVSEPHTLWHQHVSHPFKDSQHLHKELNRLEQNATGASTHDERLAYELKAIELKISMQTGKRPDPVDQPDIERIKPPPFNVSSVYITQNL